MRSLVIGVVSSLVGTLLFEIARRATQSPTLDPGLRPIAARATAALLTIGSFAVAYRIVGLVRTTWFVQRNLVTKYYSGLGRMLTGYCQW